MLYLAYNAPHYPMHAPKKYLDRFNYLAPDRRIMAAMIAAVDDGIGEIKQKLIDENLLDNTIIYFQSDNGPSRESRNWLDGTEDYYYGGTSGIFTGHKFSLFEGGIRIPAILSWKGHTEPRVVDSAHISCDIFPTILEICGGDTAKYELDGISLMPLVNGEADPQHEYLFWEMEGQTACRYGKYKLVINGQLVEFDEPRAELFLSDVEADPSESINLADEMPELCEQMKNAALTWRAGIEKRWDEEFKANYKLA